MATTVVKNYNVAPYYDDFSEAKNYHRILFKPGYSVQARELTQLQTALQAQIDRHGQFAFKDGSRVINGKATLNIKYDFIKIESDFTHSTQGALNTDNYLSDFVGTKITGTENTTNQVVAEVKAVIASENSDPNTLYIEYLESGGPNRTVQKFVAGEEFVSDASTAAYGMVGGGSNVDGSNTASSITSPIGLGSVVSIEEGVYFIAGSFVFVPAGTLILDKYTNTPNYIVGLKITESTITSNADNTLVDNAQGTPNFSAPGADRYKISTELVKQPLNLANRTEDSMITLITIENGKSSADKTDKNTDTELTKRLAKRTSEESGDYSLNPYQLNVREHLDDGVGNNGYLTSANGGDANKLAIGIEPNVAYVKGFRVENALTKYVEIDKPRSAANDTRFIGVEPNTIRVGNYIKLKTTSPAPLGMPDINTYDTLDLKSATGGGGSTLGTCRARGLDFVAGEYRLYIFDVVMSGSNNFSSVVSLEWNDGGTIKFRADLNGTETYDGSFNTLVYKLPYSAVDTLRRPALPNTTTASYTVKQLFETSAGSNTFSISGNGTFANQDIVAAIVPTSGDATSATIDNSFNGTISGASITFTDVGGATPSGSEKIVFIADVQKSALIEKGKQLQTNGSLTSQTLTTVDNTANAVSLGKADIYKVKTITAASDGADVKSKFYLDNGQRDNYYGLGKVVLKPGQSNPGAINVTFDYFTHQAGDYFSVDSYTSQVNYDSIPSFRGINGYHELRDCLDFRPRINDAGTGFDGGTAQTSDIPADSTLFTSDITHYLPRIDKLVVTRTGEFKTILGVPSENPVSPEVSDDAMAIYDLRLRPYVFNTSDVKPVIVENKRYTMRDIGNIEKRVKNLEYYTSLSLLEQSAASTQIMTGNTERLKNGFIVDSFKGHSIGDSGNIDYSASVDRTKGHLRPKFDERNVNLIRKAGEANGTSNKALKSKSIVTLPFTETNYVNQPYSSNYSNVNPYAVFSWAGTIELSPDTDEWKEVDIRPPVIIDDSEQYEQFKKMAEEEGILGTVWNEWETNWTGVDVQSEQQVTNPNARVNTWFAEQEPRFEEELNGQGRAQVSTTTTVTTTSQQSRTGINTDLAFDTITKSDGVKTIEINFIPFIRSREIHFKAQLLKPNTQVYAFFDGANVANYVKEDTFVEFTDQSSIDTFEGSTSHPDTAGALITDASGIVEGSFIIPRNAALKFATGAREFRLTDSSTNNKTQETTYAEAQYFAQGMLESLEEKIVSTKVPRLVTSEIREDRVIVDSEVSETTEWVDPVAETFLVDKAGGIFVKSVDLYFRKKDAKIPVRVTIRTTKNGYPTQRIVPGADKILYPETTSPAGEVINLPSDANANNGFGNADVATNFAFDYPVYLSQDTEYAIVITSMCDNYEVYVAEMGGQDLTNVTERIVKQPYGGVFFSSANASTWTAEQSKDLKFKLNRCSFSTSNHDINFTNDVLPKKKLEANPFFFTNGSGNVVVSHKNHGMYSTSANVTISDVASGTYKGIAHTALNGNHNITAFTHDTYTIAVGTNASGDGYAGGTGAKATENRHIDVLFPVVQNLQVPGTSIKFYATSTTGKSLNGVETPYAAVPEYEILPNRNIYYNVPQLICSAIDETEEVSGGGKSFNLRATLSTTDEALSPVIDMSRLSVHTIQNIISSDSAVTAEEVVTGGPELAKYITKKIDLNEQADVATVFMSILKPGSASVNLYYRFTTGDEDISQVAWDYAAPGTSIPTSSTRFSEVRWDINPTDLIGSIQFKIVMKSSITSQPPIIKDFRAICST